MNKIQDSSDAMPAGLDRILRPSHRSRRLGAFVAAAAVTAGLFGGAIVVASDNDQSAKPDFIVEGTVGSANVRGAVNLRCYENGVHAARVMAKIRLWTDRGEDSPRGRILEKVVIPGDDGCDEAVDAVLASPAGVTEQIPGDVSGLGPKIFEDGGYHQAEVYGKVIDAYTGDTYTGDVPTVTLPE